MSKTQVARRPGGRNGEITARIFEATTELLVDGGHLAVTFQAVAERAEIARATLYRRWASPAALVADTLRASAAEKIAIPDTGNFRSDLQVLLRKIALFIATPLGAAAIAAKLASLRGGRPLRRSHEGWTARWTEVRPIFERAKARGELAPNADAEALFARLSGALYFRLLVMGAAPDAKWIARVLEAAV